MAHELDNELDNDLDDDIELDETEDSDEFFEEEIEEEAPVKRGKGRPGSIHYVKESELRDELQKTKDTDIISERLGEIILLTVNRVATQTKYRNYTYLEDMKAEAIYQSIRGITKFDLTKKNSEGQFSSAFSYLTQIINNAFKQILKKEKKNRELRDQAIDMAISEHDSDLDFESIKRKKERLMQD